MKMRFTDQQIAFALRLSEAGTPVAGGLSSHQALAIIRGLGDVEWMGMDVVEVAPSYDHAEITAIAAATVAHDWLCLLASKLPPVD